jgi:type IV secretion system protein VirB6
MAANCPAPGPDDPLVQSLLGGVDCNVQGLVHTGYGAIFQPGAAIGGLLTALLTLYVAFIGYRLLLGQSQLRVSDFALSAVKLGVVVALATQWDTYQTVVYDLLFRGPQQLATVIAGAVDPDSTLIHGDVFAGLQTAFDQLSGFGAGYASHAPPSASPMLGGAGFGALLLTASASILLLSTLGVLLVAKIVLGLLLAVGPLFIALLLFESTRGIFEGWLRASFAFAFAPLAVTVVLGIALTMLEPSLNQMDELQKQHVYTLAPAYSVMLLILVFAGVSLGALAAGGVIALGFRLPKALRAEGAVVAAAGAPGVEPLVSSRSRAARVAAAATALDRRDATSRSSETRSSDRRTAVGVASDRAARGGPDIVRLGQQTPSRRIAGPRAARQSAPRTAPRTAP